MHVWSSNLLAQKNKEQNFSEDFSRKMKLDKLHTDAEPSAQEKSNNIEMLLLSLFAGKRDVRHLQVG